MSKFFKAFLLAFLAFPFAANAVTDASWGGAYTESQIKAYVDTYSDPSAIQFENYNGGLGEVRVQVESGNVTWDVVDVLPDQAITGCDEGLFEDISGLYGDFIAADNGDGLIADMEANGVTNLSDCCGPQIFWTYVVSLIQMHFQEINLLELQTFSMLKISLAKEEFILGQMDLSKWL